MRHYVLISSGIIGFMVPGAASACACCAEPADRFEYRIDLNREEMMQIARLRSVGTAKLYLTACGLDCVKGIDDPQAEYQVVMEPHEAAMVFDLTDMQGGYRGTVEVYWPSHLTLFGVDTEPNSGRTTTTLYKEMRVAFDLDGTGDFAGASGAEVEMVFSGFGNACHDITRFETWSVTARGEGVDFRLYGALEAE